MYSKIPVTYTPTQQNTVKYTIIPNQTSFQGKVGINANLGNGTIVSSNSLSNALGIPIVQTLQPLANLLTIFQSETFWTNALGILVGIVLIFIALQFILRAEITNSAKSVVRTAVGKG